MEKVLITTPEVSTEEQKLYAGKHVALVDGKIVASGNTSVEVFGKAKKLFPDKLTEEIGLLYIPKAEFLIL
jgi:hypothetical protein